MMMIVVYVQFALHAQAYIVHRYDYSVLSAVLI